MLIFLVCRTNQKGLVDMLEKAVNADLIQRNVDFKKKVVHVKHSMTYFSNSEGKYVFQLHPTKTHKGLPDIQSS